MNPNGTLLPLVDRVRARALPVGLVGLGGGLIWAFLNRGRPNGFDRAYLFSYIFFIGLSLGSMALLMIHRQLGGAWGFLIRRPLEAGAMTIPVMAVLFIPILVDLDKIYPWVNHRPGTESHGDAHDVVPHGDDSHGGRPREAGAIPTRDEPVAKAKGPSVLFSKGANFPGSTGIERDPIEKNVDELQGFKRAWLTPSAFTIRVAVYFAIWITLALVLNIGSRRQDEATTPALAFRLQAMSAPGLVVYFLSTSLAVIDWGMSLEPEWYSSLYGVMLIIGQGISAVALMILVAAFVSRRGETDGLDKPETFNDLGNLLLAFTMLWAYLSFSQYLIIWAGNLAEEIPWYARRLNGGWKSIGMFLMLFHFAVPFLVLLVRPLKRNIDALWKVAAWVLFVHLVDDYWLIAPSFNLPGTLPGKDRPGLVESFSLLDLIVPVGMGGIWLWAFLGFLKTKPLLVARDPELAAALKQAGGH